MVGGGRTVYGESLPNSTYSRRLRSCTKLHVKIVVVDDDDDDGYENHVMMIIQHQPHRPKNR
jgi:hypothetical protein